MKYLQLLTILLVVGMACAIPHSAADGEHAAAPNSARQGKWGWGGGWGGYGGGWGGYGWGGYGGYYPYYGGWGYGWGR